MYYCIIESECIAVKEITILDPYLIRSTAWRLPWNADLLQPLGHTDETESQELDDQYRPCGQDVDQLHQVS
jgi:hypothetical protein